MAVVGSTDRLIKMKFLRLMILGNFLSPLLLSVNASPVLTPPRHYKCPLAGETPLQVSIGSLLGGSTDVMIDNSDAGTLCTLTRLTPLTSNTNSSRAEDWELVPVARSYRRNPWERVAGPYAIGVRTNCTSVDSCLITVSHLKNVAQGTIFVLTTTNHRVTPREAIARFLEQVTFGPTRKDIQNFDANGFLPAQFAQWVKTQMNSNVSIPTYHREYFRQRADNMIHPVRAARTTRPRHPCSQNSRWKKHAIYPIDTDRPFNVTASSGGGYLISVVGVPRTVISFFNDTDGNILPPGNYQFCWGLRDYLGGPIYFRPINNDNCVQLAGGNPPVKLPLDIIASYNMAIKTLTLPDPSFFVEIEPVLYGFYGTDYFGGAGYVSKVPLSDSKCTSLPYGVTTIGIFPDGKQLIYDPRIILDENTVLNPIPDGGGESVAAGTLCPNVPRNYQNIDNCVLSTAPTACSPLKTNPTLFLNGTTNRLLYSNSGRYVYTIRQLPMSQVSSPCTPRLRHRWMRIVNATCTTSGVTASTKNALTSMITDSGWNSNGLLVDVYLQWSDYSGVYNGYTCDASNSKTVGMMLNVSGVCHRHVHPDEGNVYDFTYWTRPDTHPGNAIALAQGLLPPIKKWADTYNTFILNFPSSHTIDRWENNKANFDYVGRSNDYVKYVDLPTQLKTKAVADAFNPPGAALEAVVVCGSYGEVANEPSFTNVFSFVNDAGPKYGWISELQKTNTWNVIALSAEDQLRQRMAWALSQILVVTPFQINEDGLSEAYLNYYDIFVRNAFGNYRDVLKAVALSPMMAEMLSYVGSKSSAYVLRNNNLKAWPDENFAREVMQLFSIGLYRLNTDGSLKLSPSGEPIPTYDNSDIQTFARAWTGFLNQPERGNIENWDWYPNRIDPLDINPRWRDVFPKRNLYDGYIGDNYPLCSDLPQQQYLKTGSKYVLLGSSFLPEYQTGDEGWTESWWLQWRGVNSLVRLSLDQSSALYRALCDPGPSGSCRFKSVVTLSENLSCRGVECNLDNVRTVRVSSNPPIYYEYIRPACVELSVYSTGKKVRNKEGSQVMCADSTAEEAREACCQSCEWWNCKVGRVFCNFSGERVRYSTADNRCKKNNKFSNGYICDWSWIDSDYSNPGCTEYSYDDWHWTDQNCVVKAKVDSTGKVAIIHDPKSSDTVFPDYNSVNENFFPVTWDGGAFPSPSDGCGGGVCTVVSDTCVCELSVVESIAFSTLPSYSSIIDNLSIGSVPPSWYGSNSTIAASVGGVDVYHIDGTPYSKNTRFGIVIAGEKKFFKNMRSTVVIGSGLKTFRFRNPPHFVNFMIPDVRDVMYETDAVLDHYFYHDNTAPFIARRVIQRFGISNPSPRYVETAAVAFRTGSYTSQNITFGDGRYGNLGAMLAAIVLDREARSVVLDADPSYGSLREPMIKLIAFMRAMKFETRDDVREVTLIDLSNSIGQMPHLIPNVFSYFLPDYAASGPIKSASLVSPEAQVQTSPTFVGFLNGIISLADLGLSGCYGGFGQARPWCPLYGEARYDNEDFSEGFLHYVPRSADPDEIADELSLLLTSGRLSTTSRRIIADMINYAPTLWDGIRIAQKVIAVSPEFHVTGLTSSIRAERPDMPVPAPSDNPYKAIIFVMLDGGMDSYNVLIPHSGCASKDLYAEYASIRGELALNKNDVLQIDARASSQPCTTFGVHPALDMVRQLYNQGDLAFLANTGVLQEYVNKTDWWWKTTKTALFAHNTQSDEVAYVDVFDQKAGFGVCGRLADAMGTMGYKSGTLSVNGVAETLASKLTPLFVVSPNDFEKVNPIPWSEDITRVMKLMNKSNKVGSSLFGETWSNSLFKALGENELLYDAFTETDLSTTFPSTDLSRQLEGVAKLIDTKDIRGTDRDAFFVEIGGFDTHSNLIESFADRAREIDGALGAFAEEMKAQGRWNDVVIVFVSEFARTLTPNTSRGSDHAWGGNYFLAGGSVNGGKIFGQYISDFTEDGPINFNPGVVIPTTSWDQVWEPIAKWYGIPESGLDDVIPSRRRFNGPLNLFA